MSTYDILSNLLPLRLFRRWRKPSGDPEDGQIEFWARLKDFREDGWVSPELLLENHSEVTVWVEEASITLSELEANWQTTSSTGQAIHPIRQNIAPGDTLSLSIARAIYDAAGRPQGPYSCLVLTNVRYSVFDEWRNVQLETCCIEMAALAVVNFRRARWYKTKTKGMNPTDLVAK